ncbi:SDR family NAD(P)-dependent oxidoreductase [Halomicroarcula sp. GCM10025817]|uniref:SDR family NAD(P)-dependent oxidoreductase n=1 Tax=Haloarcula TaxID=2237 RepID=UPI0023E7EC76|nr:glucose 1-dehydrogenase [Halomicroarcula sp. SYNS111]
MVGHTEYDYTGESAIVTGSTKGIGRGIAEGLAEAGANVVVNARDEQEVANVADELDDHGEGSVVGVTADVSDPAAIEHLVDSAVDAFGEIDLLVNNAATWPEEASLVESSLDQWNRTMDVNVRSQYYAAKLVAEHMIAEGIEGCIVNHTSQAGDRRTGPFGLYGISKTSINGLTWRMAQELAEHGIRMNAISTDVTETAQTRYEAEQTAMDHPDRTAEEVLRERGEKRPLGRLGQPEDLADAVLWLASDRADYVVGDIVRVSGGGNLE